MKKYWWKKDQIRVRSRIISYFGDNENWDVNANWNNIIIFSLWIPVNGDITILVVFTKGTTLNIYKPLDLGS